MPRCDPIERPISEESWQRVVYYACIRKTSFTRADEAHELRRRQKDSRLRVYRCPFADGRPHWHLGHVPSWRTVRRIAAAIRARAQEQGRAA